MEWRDAALARRARTSGGAGLTTKEVRMVSVRDLIPWGRNRASGGGEGAHPMVALHREMNRLFDDFARGIDPWFGGASWPRVDVREDAEAVEVVADLPGLSEKDVEVTISDGALVIQGETAGERSQEGDGLLMSERQYGRFHRAIPLGVEIDRERVSAKMKDGVLTVTLPKSAEARQRTKRIPISGK
jgi:HSP20 family protein